MANAKEYAALLYIAVKHKRPSTYDLCTTPTFVFNKDMSKLYLLNQSFASDRHNLAHYLLMANYTDMLVKDGLCKLVREGDLEYGIGKAISELPALIGEENVCLKSWNGFAFFTLGEFELTCRKNSIFELKSTLHAYMYDYVSIVAKKTKHLIGYQVCITDSSRIWDAKSFMVVEENKTFALVVDKGRVSGKSFTIQLQPEDATTRSGIVDNILDVYWILGELNYTASLSDFSEQISIPAGVDFTPVVKPQPETITTSAILNDGKFGLLTDKYVTSELLLDIVKYHNRANFNLLVDTDNYITRNFIAVAEEIHKHYKKPFDCYVSGETGFTNLVISDTGVVDDRLDIAAKLFKLQSIAELLISSHFAIKRPAKDNSGRIVVTLGESICVDDVMLNVNLLFNILNKEYLELKDTPDNEFLLLGKQALLIADLVNL